MQQFSQNPWINKNTKVKLKLKTPNQTHFAMHTWNTAKDLLYSWIFRHFCFWFGVLIRPVFSAIGIAVNKHTTFTYSYTGYSYTFCSLHDHDGIKWKANSQSTSKLEKESTLSLTVIISLFLIINSELKCDHANW